MVTKVIGELKSVSSVKILPERGPRASVCADHSSVCRMFIPVFQLCSPMKRRKK